MSNPNELNEWAPDPQPAPDKDADTGPPRIIIAEDDMEMSSLLVRAFKKAGYQIKTCQSGWELLKVLGIFPASKAYKDVDLVVSDIRLPGITGLEALKMCNYVGEFPPIILITAFGDNWTHKEAERLGAVDMLDKPFDIDELVNRVRKLIPVSS